MKYRGEDIKKPEEEVLVIPVGDDKIILKFATVVDFSEFDKLVAEPNPVKRVHAKTCVTVEVPDHPEYLAALNDYSTKRLNWMILESLKATPDLEFETVDSQDPDTWGNWQEEFKAAGFSQVVMAKVLDKVITVCGLNSEMIDKATSDFLADQAGVGK